MRAGRERLARATQNRRLRKSRPRRVLRPDGGGLQVTNAACAALQAPKKVATQKKSDKDGDEVIGFGGMHYHRTKEEEEMAKQGPSFSDVSHLHALRAPLP